MPDKDYELVLRCLKRDVAAEYELYRLFTAKMYGICLRYGGNDLEGEEILQIGFISLFRHLDQFRFEGSFEGWVHQIFVNTAINYCKKQLRYNQHVTLKYVKEDATLQEDALSMIATKELLAVIQCLPPGYRAVFNMFVIEGYEHKEIAKSLGIQEGTSKSQLFQAKASVRRMLKEMEI